MQMKVFGFNGMAALGTVAIVSGTYHFSTGASLIVLGVLCLMFSFVCAVGEEDFRQAPGWDNGEDLNE